jgi:hypothetical protein
MREDKPVRVQTEEAPINMRRLRGVDGAVLADRLRNIRSEMPASWFLFDGAQINAIVRALDFANRAET